MKGIATVGVFVSHIGAFMGIQTNTKIDVALAMGGYLFVSVFLFLSGYGVQRQFTLKGKTYIDTFLRRRIVPMYANLCIATVLYVLADILKGKVLTLGDIVGTLLFGKTIVSNGWYIQVALLLYILFYAVSLWKGNTTQSRVALALLIGVYCLLAITTGLSAVWYQTVWMFFAGILFAVHDVCILKLEKHRNIWIGVSSILFVVFVGLRSIDQLSTMVRMMLTIASEISWIIIWICFIKEKNLIIDKLLCWIGNHSFEIYIFQGIAFRVARHIISNQYLALIASIGLVLLIAACFHWLFSNVKKYIIDQKCC